MTPMLMKNKFAQRSLTLAFLFVVTLTMTAAWASPQEEGSGVPAYNSAPPPNGRLIPAPICAGAPAAKATGVCCIRTAFA